MQRPAWLYCALENQLENAVSIQTKLSAKTATKTTAAKKRPAKTAIKAAVKAEPVKSAAVKAVVKKAPAHAAKPAVQAKPVAAVKKVLAAKKTTSAKTPAVKNLIVEVAVKPAAVKTPAKKAAPKKIVATKVPAKKAVVKKVAAKKVAAKKVVVKKGASKTPAPTALESALKVAAKQSASGLPKRSSKPIDPLKAVIMKAVEDLKAKDVMVLDVRARTTVTDELIIATGTSTRHVKSIADSVVKACKAFGIPPIGVEGEGSAEWVLVDLGDYVVHVFQAEMREFYALEKLWGGNTPIDNSL
jgi:ribosome-associated protein